MSFYDTPCNVCGKGIERTGKRGRPPVTHPLCKGQQPKPAAAVNPETPVIEVDIPEPDEDAKVVDKFLRSNNEPRSRPLPPFDPSRITIMARKLEPKDVLWIRRDQYEVSDVTETPNREHVNVKLVGHPQGSLKIIADGNVLIAPRD